MKLSTMKMIVITGIFVFVILGCDQEGASDVAGKSKQYLWKMTTAWPSNFPIVDEAAKMTAKMIETMSNGQIKIQVYGGGELIPPFEVFNNVSKGTIEMGHSAPYYWVGKVPAAVPYSCIPFGLIGLHQATWIYQTEAGKLWEEIYAKHNVVPFYAGSTQTQMGGWFNKEIKSVSDLKGLKMRIPGWGGKVISKLGGTSVSLPSAEIYTALEKGVVDAAEWIGPGNDDKMGLSKVAKYYYYPGWHEPGPGFEMIINKKIYDELPVHLKEIVKAAIGYCAMWTSTKFEIENAKSLAKMQSERIVLKKFPPSVMRALQKASDELIAEEIAKDADLKKIIESLKKFKNLVAPWYNISEGAIAPYLYNTPGLIK